MTTQQGQTITREAIRDGKLVPLDKCEICGKQRWSKVYSFENAVVIHPHHYMGYDFPFNVWWICRSCNRKLINKHDGSFTIEEAREFIFGKKDELENCLHEAKKQALLSEIETTKRKLTALQKQLALYK